MNTLYTETRAAGAYLRASCGCRPAGTDKKTAAALRRGTLLLAILAFGASVFAGEAAAVSLQEKLQNATGFELNGFVEMRAGTRLASDPGQQGSTIAETRMQIDLARELSWGALKIKADAVADGVEEELRFETREFFVALTPAPAVDMKVGRQILTWGTGDLLFINDLFPKGWTAFFTGRDDEYLKLPSDAVKASVFLPWASVDLVYTPLFNGSDYIDGSRISYWNGSRVAGRDDPFVASKPGRFFRDDELALRIAKNIGAVELALYGHTGFWQTPEGRDAQSGRGVYPRLNVWGASVRAPVAGGIAHGEFGWYDSRDDADGDNPLVKNSEVRLLAGFERELARDLTAGFQYYLEWMRDHDAYLQTLPAGAAAADLRRHVLTLRLTRMLMSQNLRLSLFVYYSPSDADAYLRPKFHYKVSDRWSVDGGANIFTGKKPHTFFGQFEDAGNVYLGARYNF